MAGPDLASMLKDGGDMPPPGPGGPPDGDADDMAGGKMSPDQAIQILQHFKIPPDPQVLQQVCDAAQAGMALLQQQGEGAAPEGGQPAGGPPPPPGA